MDNNIIGQDPLLDPSGLQDNGGSTQTIALLPNSPVIDLGSNPDNLATDQRGTGFDRESNDIADIGAFEVQAIIGDNNVNSLFGTTQANLILGKGGDDSLTGFAGEDSLEGGDGADYISAGAGDDTLNGSAGENRLYGRIGNDLLLGGDDKDRLFGGFDDDTLEGGANNDFLFGAKGDDLLIGGSGQNVLRGGEGNDIFFLEPSTEKDLIVDYEDGIDKFQLGSSLTFNDLTIFQSSLSTGAFIMVTNTNEVLARVLNEDTSNITSTDFI